ncbi:prepilin-type N-terminal cleavage/methylation domain-containing protein [Candidatus Poribacteria bacterium]
MLKRLGFTIVEIIITVAIVAILIAMAIPVYQMLAM